MSEFGQSGDIESVYRFHGIGADSIIRAVQDLVEQMNEPTHLTWTSEVGESTVRGAVRL